MKKSPRHSHESENQIPASAGMTPLRNGMTQIAATILAHRRIARDHYLMRLRAPVIARRSLPGQFIHVQCGGRGQSTAGLPAGSMAGTVPLLRRPFSLYDADPKAGTIDFIYKVVGLGTSALAEIGEGRRVDLLGPLGRPFTIPPDLETAYLIGGGVGIPPLYLLAKWLLHGKSSRRPPQIAAFLGARTKDWIICAADFRRLGIPVHIATDDGSLGHRGSVVSLLSRFASSVRAEPTALYICGPTPMMKAAARLARQRHLPAEVSLEERMGCAMGCCMGCVVEVATEPATSHARFQRVCTEGPVFPAEMIQWSAS